MDGCYDDDFPGQAKFLELPRLMSTLKHISANVTKEPAYSSIIDSPLFQRSIAARVVYVYDRQVKAFFHRWCERLKVRLLNELELRSDIELIKLDCSTAVTASPSFKECDLTGHGVRWGYLLPL